MSSTTIEVAKYIHDLLYEYSSVIVPDLGAFSTRNKMANINEEDQTIHPPIKTVVFNEKLTINDGILAGHIAKMESIPPALVSDALKKFAADTKATLNAGEAVPLGNLGTLQYQAEKGIEFYPTQDLNLSLDSFGLETLSLPSITATTPPTSDENIGAATIGNTSSNSDFSLEEEKNLPEEEEIPVVADEKRTVSSVLAENAQNLPPIPTPEKRRRSGGGWFWLLPFLILGLCLILIFQLGKGDKDKTSPIADNNVSSTEESSSFWDFPPFNWFSGGNEDKSKDALADNSSDTNMNHTNTNAGNSSNDNQNEDASTENKSANNSNNSENTSTENAQESTKDASGNSNNNTDENTNSNNEDVNKSTTTNTPKEDNTSTSESASNTNDDATSNSNNNTNTTTQTTDSNAAVTLTNTATLNGINVTEARKGEYLNTNTPKGYYIIVGAFKSKTNANKAVNKLKGKGYKASALQSTSGYYRVGIYGSTDGKTAKDTYAKARSNENPKAWMLNYQ